MIKPTIGRVVWFWALGSSPLKEDSQPFPALVTYVHSDTCVNLAVFDRSGDHRPYQGVELWQGEGERPYEPHCEWMPYQKGQATKQDDSPQFLARLAQLEAEVASMRQFIGSVAKDVVNKQSGAGVSGINRELPQNTPGIPQPPVPPPAPRVPPPAKSNLGEDPSKDGTGVA